MKLSNLAPIYKKIRYGSIGTNGELGYDNFLVSVNNKLYENTISAHPDSKIIYELDGKYNNLSIKCALNDSSDLFARADFKIYSDSFLVASSINVSKNEIRDIDIDVKDCQKLTLEINTNKPEFCHALWLDGILHSDTRNYINGCMGDIKISIPSNSTIYDLCICICITPDYLMYAKNLLESIKLNSKIDEYKIILFTFDLDQNIKQFAQDYDCFIVECQRSASSTFLLKTALYSAAKVIKSSYYILMDIDMIVAKPINEIVDLLKSSNKKSIFITREQSIHNGKSVGHVLVSEDWPYFGNETSNYILGLNEYLHNFQFVCNGGLIAGSRQALLSLDDMIRTILPGSNIWEKQNPQVKWREQGVLNLALAKLNNIIELDNKYNFQLLHSPLSDSKKAIILHFNGEYGKKQYKNYKLKEYKENKLTNEMFSRNIQFFNDNLDFNVLDQLNVSPLNVIDFNDYENILIINDIYNIYSSYIIDIYDKSVYAIASSENNSMVDFLKLKDKFNVINLKDSGLKFDCIIVNMCEIEQLNLSYCLIGFDLLNENGHIFVTENVNVEQKLKERLLDKKIKIKELGNFFQLIRE